MKKRPWFLPRLFLGPDALESSVVGPFALFVDPRFNFQSWQAKSGEAAEAASEET